MKPRSITRKQYCHRRVDLTVRDNLAVKVFYAVNDQLDVMTFDEACSWTSCRSDNWFNAVIGESGVQNLYYQGKRQRSKN